MLSNQPTHTMLPASNLARAKKWYAEKVATVGSERATWFKDSEGNLLALFETIR